MHQELAREEESSLASLNADTAWEHLIRNKWAPAGPPQSSTIFSIMTRRFFVGGNFKMNPCSQEEKLALIKVLNEADLDPSTGTQS